jgi:hypothetical protein
MITQYEVPGYLAEVLPARALQPQICHLTMNIYKDLQQFTDYTRQAVDQHNYTLAKKCFRLADRLYTNGDRIVRNAVENIFVFSFSSFIPRDSVEKIILKSFIPATLYALYVKQVSEGGC